MTLARHLNLHVLHLGFLHLVWRERLDSMVLCMAQILEARCYLEGSKLLGKYLEWLQLDAVVSGLRA